MKKWLWLALTISSQSYAQALPALSDLDAWSEQSFVEHSQYEVIEGVLHGRAEAAASALGVEIEIPAGSRLSWRWAIDQLPDLGEVSEQSKQGDDFGARVYVVRKGSFGLLSTKSLVYVYSQSKQPGQMWPSPYTSKVVMVAVQPAQPQLGEWQQVERDIAEDWLAAFGDTLDAVDGVAVMVDADNTGTQARARFADLQIR